MATRRVTMQQLYRLARRDRRFFEALLKNPREALAAKGLSLSPADLRTLQRALRKVYKISGKDLARVLMTGKGKIIVPWPTVRPWLRIRPWPTVRF